MDKKKNNVAKDLRTPKYRKRVVALKNKRLPRKEKHKAMAEDAPANATGPAVPGTGDTGEVFVKKKKFAGKTCFEVNGDTYHKCLQGKKQYKHWKSYVGECDTGKAIREYAYKNRDEPIIVQDERTGAMTYIKYGKK